MTKRGVAICHYNRHENLKQIIEAVQATTPEHTKIVVCDDGSLHWNHGPKDSCNLEMMMQTSNNFILVKGSNLGVAANKNRALFALQDCDFITILEDDLMPTEGGWFEAYEQAVMASGIHHFCRVQDKLLETKDVAFDEYMQSHNLTPIYGPHPRGDLTFITKAVVEKVGAFNKRFRGAGYAHGEWSNRVWRSGLIEHPNKWVDIQEASAKFIQIGDTEGGRWDHPEDTQKELEANALIRKELDMENYVHLDLELE